MIENKKAETLPAKQLKLIFKMFRAEVSFIQELLIK